MPFDVLRLVSDPGRWKQPSWKVASMAGRDIHAMARPGWCMQGQIYSRDGLRKIADQLPVVDAPIDAALYHNCHVKGLRVLEVRPGLVEPDKQFAEPSLVALSDIGYREGCRLPYFKRKVWRWRQKLLAATRFVQAWGLTALRHVLVQWPPAGYFR